MLIQDFQIEIRNESSVELSKESETITDGNIIVSSCGQLRRIFDNWKEHPLPDTQLKVFWSNGGC